MAPQLASPLQVGRRKFVDIYEIPYISLIYAINPTQGAPSDGDHQMVSDLLGSLTSVCACSALANPQSSGYEVGMAKETRWDRKSEARVRRAVLNNPRCPSAQDRLDLKAKAAADQHERDDWERGVGLYDEG